MRVGKLEKLLLYDQLDQSTTPTNRNTVPKIQNFQNAKFQNPNGGRNKLDSEFAEFAEFSELRN